jgi:plastocyanin
LVSVVALGATHQAGHTAGSNDASLPTGTISGTIILEPPPPPRRSANRYPDASARSHAVQVLPAVVYLKGAIAGAPPAGNGTNSQMMQRDTAFAPPVVAVQVGGTVVFPNEDSFFHNVFSYSSAKRFDLGRYPQGEAKEVVFDKAGIVQVFCEVHDFMRGAIIITENPYHAVVDENGDFSLDGVPAGEYTLVAWHPDHDELERTVTVTDGGNTRIEVELRR